MCGRFVSSSPPDKIAEFFGASFEGDALPANHNVAPTNDIYAVAMGPSGTPVMQAYHWGLVPTWAKDIKIGSKLINARSETVAAKPAFRSAFKKHRILIPMDGFYEWAPGRPDGPLTKAGKPVKQPMFIHRKDGEPLAVAGLWSAWRDRETGPDAPWLHSCTILTTAANATMSTIHDRMPVVLPRSKWEEWLDTTNDDTEALLRLLVPAPDDILTMHPVSLEVNNVRNKGGHLVDAIDPAVGANSA